MISILEVSMTGQCQTNIYLAWRFVRYSKKLLIVSGVDTCNSLQLMVSAHVPACESNYLDSIGSLFSA